MARCSTLAEQDYLMDQRLNCTNEIIQTRPLVELVGTGTTPQPRRDLANAQHLRRPTAEQPAQLFEDDV